MIEIKRQLGDKLNILTNVIKSLKYVKMLVSNCSLNVVFDTVIYVSKIFLWWARFGALCIIDKLNLWLVFSFKLLIGSGVFLSSSSFHLYLRICNSFANVRWFAKANSFLNYSAVLINFIFAWKRDRTFFGVPYNIKLTFINCRSLSFLLRIFASFLLFCRKGKRKGIRFRYSNTKISDIR